MWSAWDEILLGGGPWGSSFNAILPEHDQDARTRSHKLSVCLSLFLSDNHMRELLTHAYHRQYGDCVHGAHEQDGATPLDVGPPRLDEPRSLPG